MNYVTTYEGSKNFGELKTEQLQNKDKYITVIFFLNFGITAALDMYVFLCV